MRRLLHVAIAISSIALAVPTGLTAIAMSAGAQVPAPPAGAGQQSSYVIDASSTAPVISTTTKAPTKRKVRSMPTTTISTVAPVPEPDTSPVAAPAALTGSGIADSVWAALRKCESNGDYTINTGNTFYGAYQFAAGTWRKLGYAGLPHEAAPAVQDEAARKLQGSSGWGPWPACSRKLGLR